MLTIASAEAVEDLGNAAVAAFLLHTQLPRRLK